MIPDSRIKILNKADVLRNRFVVYWMQASQRVSFNHALEYSIDRANELGRPLIVYFGLTPDYPGANLRHYLFMLDGLRETVAGLFRRGIQTVIRIEPPQQGIVNLSSDACLVVTDVGYTRIQKAWRRQAARHLSCPLIRVETDVVVPVEEASLKEEYSAATLRPKLLKRLDEFICPLKKRAVVKDSLSLRFEKISPDEMAGITDQPGLDRSVGPASFGPGGGQEARRRLRQFLERGLDVYDEAGGDPTRDGLSGMSPYLHFGQISPLEIVLDVRRRKSPGEEAFLEQLIVRRELSMNFVHFNSAYDRTECLPAWARKTLAVHSKDPREYHYSEADLEAARTHDPYWNAAQSEMVLTGKMHGYMRMYWGKKILEWSRSPEEAFAAAVRLNDKYELDGRDPNGYTGVAWCFGKHDRAWVERPVFGKIRYMNDRGLRRKFDIEAYVRRIAGLKPSG